MKNVTLYREIPIYTLRTWVLFFFSGNNIIDTQLWAHFGSWDFPYYNNLSDNRPGFANLQELTEITMHHNGNRSHTLSTIQYTLISYNNQCAIKPTQLI